MEEPDDADALDPKVKDETEEHEVEDISELSDLFR